MNVIFHRSNSIKRLFFGAESHICLALYSFIVAVNFPSVNNSDLAPINEIRKEAVLTWGILRIRLIRNTSALKKSFFLTVHDSRGRAFGISSGSADPKNYSIDSLQNLLGSEDPYETPKILPSNTGTARTSIFSECV